MLRLGATLILVLLLPTTICAQPGGVVFTVEGMGALDVFRRVVEAGFGRAGLPHEVRRFYWSHGHGRALLDLQDHAHAEARAEELARIILTQLQNEPRRPVYLLGYSAGAGIALRAAEMLPAGSVERIILLAAAVAPTRDLRPALRVARAGVVAYYSPHDDIMLNWGTRRFGTADGVFTIAAGNAGFIVPRCPCPEDRPLYDRLVQVGWHPGMILRGHFGGHFGVVMPCFLKAEVARWLR